MQLNNTLLPVFPPVQNGNTIETMSSLQIADVVKSRHDNVKVAIERLVERGVIQCPAMQVIKNHQNRSMEVYNVIERDSYIVVAQLSPEFTAVLVDEWQRLKGQYRQIDSAEALLRVLQFQMNYERQQAEQAQAIQQIGSDLSALKTAHMVLDKMPSDCESISKIRIRMNKTYGLSSEVVTQIAYHSPYALTVRTIVRNPSADAEGSHFSGYSKKEVTAVFKRFVSECTKASPTMWEHPYVNGRFRLLKGGEA